MVRTNQGGSILGFVIIGGVLALLLVGGAYFVRHTLSPTDEREEPVVSQNDGDDSAQSSDDEPDASKEKDEQTDEEATLPGRTDANSPSSQDNEALDDLPQTGPEGSLLAGILLSGIVAVGTAYKRSRDITTSL